MGRRISSRNGSGSTTSTSSYMTPSSCDSFLHLLWWSLFGIPVGIGASLLVALLIYRLDSKRAQYWFRVAFSPYTLPTRYSRHPHMVRTSSRSAA